MPCASRLAPASIARRIADPSRQTTDRRCIDPWTTTSAAGAGLASGSTAPADITTRPRLLVLHEQDPHRSQPVGVGDCGPALSRQTRFTIRCQGDSLPHSGTAADPVRQVSNIEARLSSVRCRTNVLQTLACGTRAVRARDGPYTRCWSCSTIPEGDRPEAVSIRRLFLMPAWASGQPRSAARP